MNLHPVKIISFLFIKSFNKNQIILLNSFIIFLGNETALRIYLDEILSLTSVALNSSNWLMKSQAANSISSLIKPQLSFQLNQIHLLTEVII